MNEIAKIKQGEWTLTHSWCLDDFGWKRNVFEISHIREDGRKYIIPFQGKIRVNNYDRNTPYGGDDISPYETFEYAEMLAEQIEKINHATYEENKV